MDRGRRRRGVGERARNARSVPRGRITQERGQGNRGRHEPDAEPGKHQHEVAFGRAIQERRKDLAHQQSAEAEAHDDHARQQTLLVGKPSSNGCHGRDVAQTQPATADDPIAHVQ